MIRREWQKHNPDPYIACQNNSLENPMYRQCGICPNNTWCEYGVAEYGRQKLEDIVIAMRESDIKYKSTCYQNELGFWHNDERFDKVSKHNFLKGTTPRFSCFSGFAGHPDFWKCEKCAEVPTCEIGQYQPPNEG